MPAMAVTEHGNMFSSVIFHDHARASAGIKPILGCEVYVAPGDRRDEERHAGRDANHLVLLAETNEGYHNLIKLVSAGYTEGFYYKPRIDKELLAQHAKGLIGLSSCLKGEVADGHLAPSRSSKAHRGGGGVPRHPRARATSSSRCSTRASTSSGSSTAGCRRSRGSRPAAGRAPTTCTTCSRPTAQPHDILLCIGTGKTVNDAEAAALPRRSVLPEDRRGDGGRSSRIIPDALANTVRIAERCNVDAVAQGQNHLPNFDVPAGFTLDDYFEHVVARGLRAAAAAAAASWRRAGALRHTHRRVRAPARRTRST